MKNKNGESESKKKSEKSIWFVKFKSSNGVGKNTSIWLMEINW